MFGRLDDKVLPIEPQDAMMDRRDLERTAIKGETRTSKVERNRGRDNYARSKSDNLTSGTMDRKTKLRVIPARSDGSDGPGPTG